METPEHLIPDLLGDMYPYSTFVQNDVMGNVLGLSGLQATGVILASKYQVEQVSSYMCGMQPRTKIVPPGSGTHTPVLLHGKIEVKGEIYLVGAVHFTWTKEVQWRLR